MRPEAWLDVFRDMAIQIQGKVASLSGTPEARREIRVGAGGDTTTWIDQQAEEVILRRLLSLQDRGENFTLISEELGVKEFGAGGPHLLVDPIDGSLNAKRGIPFFSTSFALVDGETLSGTRAGLVINLANGDQFWATRGEGAFLNGCPLQTKGSEKMEILAYEANRPPSDLAILSPLLPFAVRTRCLGSTALDLCYTAYGHLDLFIIPRSSRSLDLAAGKLILEESGGIVTDLEGNDLGSLPLDLQHRTSLLASSSLAVHQQAVQILSRGHGGGQR